MGIESQLVAPALENVALLNLDMAADGRRAAIAEAADHLEALAALPPLSKGAGEVVRMVEGMGAPWGDRHTWLRLMADALRAKAA